MKNMNKTKILHIAIILIGAILMLAGAFHTNIWFDEAYTVGLMNHNIIDIIKIGIHDVHPLFYYLMLKIFTIFTGNSIIAMRIFSVLGMILLSIIGYTHIRKDFNEKVGIIFSLLISFLPVTLLYSNEIRMYSWAAVFVLLTGVYACRITKQGKTKDWVLFSIFSLFSAYTHYFSMMSIGLINLILFIYVIRNREKNKNIIKWVASAATQIILFIPGIIVFLFQAIRVAVGFWIEIKYPDILIDILKFNFLGIITNKWVNLFVLIFASIFFIYLIVKTILEYKKDKSKVIAPIMYFAVYLGVIIIALIISNISEIFTTRYTIPMIGLLAVFIAYILSVSNKKILYLISGIIILLSINNAIIFFNDNYNEANSTLCTLINEEIKEDDIFVYSDINLGAVIADYFPNNKQYFYNYEHWTVEEAYKAFAPQMETIETLDKIDDYSGRIWVIDNTSNKMYDIISKYENINVIKKQENLITPYKDTTWVISLIEKK